MQLTCVKAFKVTTYPIHLMFISL